MYNPDQPRVPAGSSGGGEFGSLGGSAGGHPGQIATANMTSAKADKSVYKQPSVVTMAGEGETNPKIAELYKKNFASDVGLFGNSDFYPNFRPSELQGTPREQADTIVKNMASNLAYIYNNTTSEIRNAGLQWYDGAHKIVEDISAKYKLDPASVVGTFAKLSPNKDWNQNVELGRRVVDIYATKQNYKFDKEMEAQALKTWAVKNINGRPVTPELQASAVFQKKDAAYAVIRNAIAGKTLGELKDPTLKAAWIRTYDEAHNPQTYPLFMPDGTSGPLVRNNPTPKDPEGKPSTLVWQSTPLIADAVSALEANGDRDKLSDLMGEGHKVRSFYNNILDPHSPNQDVTIDTHAVGAALMRSLGLKSVPVNHNFGLTPEKSDQPKGWKAASGSAITGLSGTYGLYADATRLAAKMVGVEPTQMQAVTWEAKRSTLGQTSDKADEQIEQTWKDYHDEKISQADAQEKVWKIANEDVAAKGVARAAKLKSGQDKLL